MFFAAGYTAPLRLSCPSVVAVYDVSFFAHPEWFATRERLPAPVDSRGARPARAPGRDDLASSPRRRSCAGSRSRASGSSSRRPRRRRVPAADASGPRPPIVLFVGSLFNRRRIPELLQAFAQVAQAVPDARLVLGRRQPDASAGSIPRARRELGIGDRGGLARVCDRRRARRRCIGSARVFVFLSDYEGFAMTPLEALAHGVPSVLLDTPIAREVYGDAARLVAPGPGDDRRRAARRC